MTKTIDFFYEISKIPRESGNEEEIANYLCNFAKERNLYFIKDKFNNVIIKKESSPKEPIILQAHMDMVCEKDENKIFDFKKDPIEVYEENGFLCAKGTTLGADNGIGVAQVLNILDSDNKVNIEAVFTTSEETTMIGAENIDVSSLNGRELICLDGFEENTIFLESAGFYDIILQTKLKLKKTKGKETYKIKLFGLDGGHSGFDINKNKGNSSQILSKILIQIKDIELNNFVGGTKFNVIPSTAESIFNTKLEKEELENILRININELKKEYPNIKIELCKYNKENKFINNEESIKYLTSIIDFKHGVSFKNKNNEVTTSINLGVVNLQEQIFKIGMRSSRNKEASIVIKEIKEYSKLYNYKYVLLSSQPGFETKETSQLVKKMIKSYEKINKEKPNLKSIHITVESGFFKEKIKNLDVAIISPKIIGAHTTNESVSIESIKKCDEWLRQILED